MSEWDFLLLSFMISLYNSPQISNNPLISSDMCGNSDVGACLYCAMFF